MLLVVLNDKKASGLKAANVMGIAEKTRPLNGDVRITHVQKDGLYVVIFDDRLRGYAFGSWCNEHSVKNTVCEVRGGDDKALGKKLVELLPSLAKELAVKAGGSRSEAAQLKREETIQMLVDAIANPKGSAFSLFK